jgi:hypothetical protein
MRNPGEVVESHNLDRPRIGVLIGVPDININRNSTTTTTTTTVNTLRRNESTNNPRRDYKISKQCEMSLNVDKNFKKIDISSQTDDDRLNMQICNENSIYIQKYISSIKPTTLPSVTPSKKIINEKISIIAKDIKEPNKISNKEGMYKVVRSKSKVPNVLLSTHCSKVELTLSKGNGKTTYNNKK